MEQNDDFIINLINWLFTSQGDAISEYVDTMKYTLDSEESYAKGYIDAVKSCVECINVCIENKDLKEQSERAIEEWFDSFYNEEDYEGE